MRGANVLHSHNSSVTATVPSPDKPSKIARQPSNLLLNSDATVSILKKQETPSSTANISKERVKNWQNFSQV